MSIRNVSVRVNTQSPKRIGNVTYDSNIAVKVDSNQEYAVKTTNGITQIRNLQDVVAFVPHDGDVLVFNAVTGKYVSKQLDSSQINKIGRAHV